MYREPQTRSFPGWVGAADRGGDIKSSVGQLAPAEFRTTSSSKSREGDHWVEKRWSRRLIHEFQQFPHLALV
jgi:hypothetical protein